MIVNYDSRVIPDLKIPHITTLEPLFTIARPLKDWPHVYHRYFLLFITAIPEYKCSKNCRQVDSNCKPLASEAADLPAVPQPLPKISHHPDALDSEIYYNKVLSHLSHSPSSCS